MNFSDLQDPEQLQKTVHESYVKMANQFGLEYAQAEPAFNQYERRLKNLVDAYQTNVKKAAHALQSELMLLQKPSKEKNNGTGG